MLFFFFFPFLFLKYILLIMLLQFSQFSPFIPTLPCSPQPSSLPPHLVHVHGLYMYVSTLTSVSYTILNLFPSILCLPIMFLIPCTFPFSPPLPLPTENPPCDVYFSDSVPVLVVCLVFVVFVCVCMIRLSC